MSHTLPAFAVSLVVVSTVLGWSPAVHAQTSRQRGVDVPRFEFAAAMRLAHVADPDGKGSWSGPALALGINRNISAHLAAAAQVETDLRHPTAYLGGAQLSTRFYYGGGRGPVPGRFFARALVGAAGTGVSGMHPAGQFVAGADVMLSRSRAVGLRWEAGFESIADAVPQRSSGRLGVGLVFEPRVHP